MSRLVQAARRRLRRVTPWFKKNAADLLVWCGLGSAALGVGVIFVPAALILGGAVAVVLGVTMERS
jgi:hypothetical protein